jgi:hypothetical protein
MSHFMEPKLTVYQINDLVVGLSDGLVTAVVDGDQVLLRHRDEKLTIHLLPYQRHSTEITRVLLANTPWPKL